MTTLSFMEKKNDQEDVIDDLPEVEEGEEDNTDWKALAQKNQGIAKRYQTKLAKLKEAAEEQKKAEEAEKAKPSEPKPKSKKEGFDYAEKAYLKVSKITPDEYPLVQDWLENSNCKDIEEVMENSRFQNELIALREQKASVDAVPKGTKRSAQSSRDKVDYWLAKGEMPPADQINLRREYVNAKLKRETDKSKFTDQPIVE